MNNESGLSGIERHRRARYKKYRNEKYKTLKNVERNRIEYGFFLVHNE